LKRVSNFLPNTGMCFDCMLICGVRMNRTVVYLVNTLTQSQKSRIDLLNAT
jgi:hypothetical protein